MPKPMFTLAAARTAFDTMVIAGAVTNAEKVAARRIFLMPGRSQLWTS